tara:strand:- start:782 stop:1465 length:684 start_codon:yes stop_codon:yes gene_type:complete
MNKYQDKYTRWHDKPCVNSEPSSNNGWIYTAYSKYLAPETRNFETTLGCFNECVRSYSPLRIDRSPGQLTPPLSKDEVIGMASLGLLTRSDLDFNHWNFCNLPNFKPEKLTLKSAYRAAKILYKIRKEHRNYMWQNSLTEAYPLAFYLPPEDQYYVIKYYGKKPGILRTIIFYINAVMTIYKGDKSARMMLWLKCEDLSSFLLKFIPKDKWVKDYFSEEHPFVKGLK